MLSDCLSGCCLGEICAQDVESVSIDAKYRASSVMGLLGSLKSSDMRSSSHSRGERLQADSGCQFSEQSERLFLAMLSDSGNSYNSQKYSKLIVHVENMQLKLVITVTVCLFNYVANTCTCIWTYVLEYMDYSIHI